MTLPHTCHVISAVAAALFIRDRRQRGKKSTDNKDGNGYHIQYSIFVIILIVRF